MFSPFDNLSPIFLPDPLNRQHDQAQGLVAFWRHIPGLDGGKYFYDLCGLNHGTLTNMGAGSGWASSFRPGGTGELRFDGVDDYVNCGNIKALNGVSAASMMFWVYLPTPGGDFYAGRYVSSYDSFAVFNTDVTYFNVGNGASPFYATPSAPLFSGWHHVAMVFDGTLSDASRVAGYFEGNPISLMYNGTPPSTTAVSAGNFGIGGPVVFASGSYDAIRIYSRAISAREVCAVYENDRLGNPGLVRRVPGFRFSQTSSGLLLARRRAVA